MITISFVGYEPFWKRWVAGRPNREEMNGRSFGAVDARVTYSTVFDSQTERPLPSSYLVIIVSFNIIFKR